MRYSVLGFNQEKLLSIQTDELRLDVSDVLLMDHIQRALSSPKMLKIFEGGQPYVWLQHKKILEDLPILNIKERMLQYRIEKLEKLGLIKSKSYANNNCRGSRTYYTITDLFLSMQFSEDDLTTRKELHPDEKTKCIGLHMVDEPSALDCTSNNLLNLDNKLNRNIILKNNTAEPSITDSVNTNTLGRSKRRIPNMNDDFSDKSYSREESKKEPKLNLYQKMMNEIDNFTEDDKLREALRNYVSVRLAIKDKPVRGINQWKGQLTTLSHLSGDKVAIVEQATARGWAGFWEINANEWSKNTKTKDSRAIFAEDYGVQSVRPEDVEGGESSGQVF